MKPIEPGCLCILIDGNRAGQPLEAIRLAVPSDYPFKFTAKDGTRIWKIDREVKWERANSSGSVMISLCPEGSLMRIDGDPDEEVVKEVELTQ